MEIAVITDMKGYTKCVNPSERIEVMNAVLALTPNWGIAQYLADWCEVAPAGMINTSYEPTIKVEIVNS